MKFWILVLLLPLVGCSGVSSLVTDAGLESVGKIAEVATDRHFIAGEAYKARMAAVSSANELEIAKLQSRDSVIIKIDSKDEMNAYALMKSTEAVSKANEMLGKAFMVLASGGRTDASYMYAAYTAPVGAFAEGITATGNAIGAVFKTPAAGMVAGGYAIGEILGGIEQGRTQSYQLNGDGNINVDHQEVSSITAVGDANTDTAVTNDFSENCATGECGKEGEDVEEEEFSLETCEENPPSGIIDGFPMWTPDCSCGSHDLGHC